MILRLFLYEETKRLDSSSFFLLTQVVSDVRTTTTTTKGDAQNTQNVGVKRERKDVHARKRDCSFLNNVGGEKRRAETPERVPFSKSTSSSEDGGG